MTDECIVTAPYSAASAESLLGRPKASEPVGYELSLICRSCGSRWSVTSGPDGEFFPGFWMCLRGCDR